MWCSVILDKARVSRAVSAESIRAIRRNAKWIEDEELNATLLSLAEGLKADKLS